MMLKINLLLIFSLLFVLNGLGQTDLLGQLEESTEGSNQFVSGTFKSTRVINSHSVETLKRNQLDFRISHRFGEISSGAYNLWGLDQATIRLGLEYGLSDFINIGLGRSSFDKTYDGFVKVKLLKQKKKNMPVTAVWFSNFGLTTLKTNDEYIKENYSGRISYVHQLIIGRKFSPAFSFQIAPTLVHYNYVSVNNINNLFATAFGGRYKISKRLSVNLDYVYRINPPETDPYYNSIALGVDIETGGHVFQLHITNSKGMIEQYFIGRTDGEWQSGDIFYGFNISRQFNLGRK